MTTTGTPGPPQPGARRGGSGAAVGGLLALGAAVVLTVVLSPGGTPTGPAASPSASPPAAALLSPSPTPTPSPSPTPTPTPTASAEELAAARASRLLSWAPPELEDPTTIRLSDDNRDLKLDQDRDYVLQMPDEPITEPMTVFGGRNVVLIGGEVRIPAQEGGELGRGLALKHQTGTVHVEGLAITGAGLGEGINLDQNRGAVVQLQNIRVGTVHGTRDDHHADVLQTWAGPSVLRIDGLTGRTAYQGFFLLPNQHGDQPEPEAFDLRNVDLRGSGEAGYLLWRDEDDWPLRAQDVWVDKPGTSDPDFVLWPKGEPGAEAWSGVRIGRPPGGPFVPDGLAGTGYRSPGYVSGDD